MADGEGLGGGGGSGSPGTQPLHTGGDAAPRGWGGESTPSPRLLLQVHQSDMVRVSQGFQLWASLENVVTMGWSLPLAPAGPLA